MFFKQKEIEKNEWHMIILENFLNRYPIISTFLHETKNTSNKFYSPEKILLVCIISDL